MQMQPSIFRRPTPTRASGTTSSGGIGSGFEIKSRTRRVVRRQDRYDTGGRDRGVGDGAQTQPYDVGAPDSHRRCSASTPLRCKLLNKACVFDPTRNYSCFVVNTVCVSLDRCSSWHRRGRVVSRVVFSVVGALFRRCVRFALPGLQSIHGQDIKGHRDSSVCASRFYRDKRCDMLLYCV
ncbi:hypothetical protein GWI33_021856 [Rhynchophorus ferrugineus]|uniref:Uncharacterized protein n=1 Tax=Rhynchophorus ferrugineus TaxID=354439 RepID=A0A834HME8_RHYFE|nr:hypothetical protein GWI33_021856 [Rhynchophorus ferrugineus]